MKALLKLLQCIAFLKGIHPRLGQQSAIQMIADPAVLEYIGKFIQPPAEDFIYLVHYKLGYIKVLCEDTLTIGDLKATSKKACLVLLTMPS